MISVLLARCLWISEFKYLIELYCCFFNKGTSPHCILVWKAQVSVHVCVFKLACSWIMNLNINSLGISCGFSPVKYDEWWMVQYECAYCSVDICFFFNCLFVYTIFTCTFSWTSYAWWFITHACAYVYVGVEWQPVRAAHTHTWQEGKTFQLRLLGIWFLRWVWEQ